MPNRFYGNYLTAFCLYRHIITMLRTKFARDSIHPMAKMTVIVFCLTSEQGTPVESLLLLGLSQTGRMRSVTKGV